MAKIIWDEIGERVYQTGIDHGVLYLQDGTVVPWNGLTAMEEAPNSELKPFYLDGIKYLQNATPSDFVGKLKAFTYPDEFDTVNGIAHVAPGLSYYEQQPKSFSLSFRTKIGNDIEGDDLGYKLHIVYNVIAIPDGFSYLSAQESGLQAVEFGWTLTGTPQKIIKHRPTVHISIDSRTAPSQILTLLENQLYGTEKTAPSLPPITEVGEYFGYRGALLVVDIGDGTWLAIDESNTYISMISSTQFQIDGVDAAYLDPDTYNVSSTNIGEQD